MFQAEHGFVSKAAQGEFDIREDEEQFVKLQDTLDLLIAAGYFRARIKGLSAFDKIVGGLVWSISLCKYNVDVDLLYSENSTIGQKIALTEKIVQVLCQVQCPHSIEPHQIQGLDFVHIFPVVQWLVRRVLECKEKYGDEVQNHSLYQFHQTADVPEEPFVPDLARSNPCRKYRRRAGFQSANLMEDVRCTLMEFDGYSQAALASAAAKKKQSPETEGEEEDDDDLFRAELAAQQDLTDRALEQLPEVVLEEKESKPVEDEHSSVEELKEQLAQLTRENGFTEAELQEEEEKYDELKVECNALESQLKQIKEATASVDEETMKTIKELLAEHDEIKERDSHFKKQCKEELAILAGEVESLKAICEGSESEKESVTAHVLNAKKADLLEQLQALRLDSANITREVAQLQRQLDSVPSNAELNQYQRRFIELYNQMATRHRQTKQFFTLHNTLLDVRNFMKREIDLLNSIDNSKHLASKDSYKASFVENLDDILSGIDDSLDRLVLTVLLPDLEQEARRPAKEGSAERRARSPPGEGTPLSQDLGRARERVPAQRATEP
uniref:Coiled-coil domain-containing protein 93 n=1 Tax=Steinernema glaseri TaxID=37863 RepID=A0A1I7YNC8_9BILA